MQDLHSHPLSAYGGLPPIQGGRINLSILSCRDMCYIAPLIFPPDSVILNAVKNLGTRRI